jgi:hypothetical protein
MMHVAVDQHPTLGSLFEQLEQPISLNHVAGLVIGVLGPLLRMVMANANIDCLPGSNSIEALREFPHAIAAKSAVVSLGLIEEAHLSGRVNTEHAPAVTRNDCKVMRPVGVDTALIRERKPGIKVAKGRIWPFSSGCFKRHVVISCSCNQWCLKRFRKVL